MPRRRSKEALRAPGKVAKIHQKDQTISQPEMRGCTK